MSTFKTAESVSPGHPDKICDQISDAILDAYLAKDSHSRVAVEVVGGHGKVFIVGEVTSNARIEIEPIVKRLVPEVEIEVRIVAQSPEIANGVDTGGAGDQGIMVGYACSETLELLPLEVVLSRQLNQDLFKLAEAVFDQPDALQVAVSSRNDLYELRVPHATDNGTILSVRAQKAKKSSVWNTFCKNWCSRAFG